MSAGSSNDASQGPLADHYPVIVIGGGPTGLTLANLLSRYGTRALLVERNATTVQEPRAVSIDDESLRTMQAAGVIDTVLTEIVAGYGSEYYTPKGRLFLKVEPSEQPYGYPRRNAFRQPIFEAQLRDALANSASVETWFGCELRTFKQDETGVAVELVDQTGAHRSVRCDYLVGTDGARSAVRSALGLSLDGETFQEEWLIVDLDSSPTQSKETLVFCDVARPCIALPGPNQTRRFEFKLLPGEDPEAIVEPESVNALLAAHGAHPNSRVCRKTVYTFHARLAPKWSVGRVFLAGDACHLTPPFAGQGMNSGIRDAHNLAWKLASVTAGRSPARLLESYQSERREHVRDMIQLALRMGRIMGPRNRAVGHFIQTGFRIMGLWPRCRDYFAQMKYKPKPRFEEGFIIPDKRGARHTLVGRLLPQPLVLRSNGTQALLDDVLGDGFSIIFFDEAVKASFDQQRNPIFAKLNPKSVLVSSSGSAVVGGGHDVIVDAKDILLTAAGGDRNRVLLVRPDRYVLTTFVAADMDAVASRLYTLML
ncbi:bifunctional 3-(3-hydroxy-phenyl)propionate/3-hydroxycinnamic acid hydroxylase [Blastomonas sp. AAP53]|uniref:bifunctional 3-(3-hydroxy-phenyl)propionate/3-hydroxycinnamic acid hydroxylase n=1 Tax=Blastomonas sp. AAP53 TaxID=1248760 RepID=UPI000687E7B4|nr:bifunctional 3-(3-hydroxy-phenyl)propionate/3-hydroxycinnamic acid hydroxylase [Blastomonas sp. AAP53]